MTRAADAAGAGGLPVSVREGREYPARPFVGVGVAVIRGDQVLLAQRGNEPGRGTWTIPGGMVETGETLAAAAVREVQEETGLTVELAGIVEVIDAIRTDDGGKVRNHYVLIDYAARWLGGEPVAASDADGVAWVDIANLPAYEASALLLRVVQRAHGMVHGAGPGVGVGVPAGTG